MPKKTKKNVQVAAAAKPKAKRPGRPRLPADKVRNLLVEVSVNEEEKLKLEAIADNQKQELRPWARRMLLLIADGWKLVPPDPPPPPPARGK